MRPGEVEFIGRRRTIVEFTPDRRAVKELLFLDLAPLESGPANASPQSSQIITIISSYPLPLPPWCGPYMLCPELRLFVTRISSEMPAAVVISGSGAGGR
jgi:hypothetical protein